MPDYQDYTSLIECFRCGSLLHDPKAGVPCPECGRPYHPADRYATRPRSAAGIRRTVLWGVCAVFVGLFGLALNGGFCGLLLVAGGAGIAASGRSFRDPVFVAAMIGGGLVALALAVLPPWAG